MATKSGPQLILDGLKEAGVNLIATLPDINMHLLLERVAADKEITHVPLCREEEGIGICTGGYLVGKKCALIMQNGGLFNSVNGIVSTLLQYNLPLLLLVYFAGDIGDRSFSTNGAMTQPVLGALGIQNFILRDPDEAKTLIKRTQVLTQDSKRPVAVLLTKDVLGRRQPGE